MSNNTEKVVLFVLSTNEFKSKTDVINFFEKYKMQQPFDFHFNEKIANKAKKTRNININDLVLFLYNDTGERKIYASGKVSKDTTANNNSSNYHFHFGLDIETINIYKEGMKLEDVLMDQKTLIQVQKSQTPPYITDEDTINSIKSKLFFQSFEELIQRINKDLRDLSEELQEYRKQYWGLKKIPSYNLFPPHRGRKYTFHDGGLKEIQFNIGIEEKSSKVLLRYGLAFSLQQVQSLVDPVSELKVFIDAFNKVSKNEYIGCKLYKNSEEVHQNIFSLYQTGDFLFFGKYCEWNDKLDYVDILATFRSLFPLYKKVMGEKKVMVYLKDRIIPLLEQNKQIILNGAPGTGKTYLAKKIAKYLTNDNELCYKLVQFHPSYDYTDFVDGLKPYKTSTIHSIQFELLNGSFKEFCRIAGVIERIEAANKKVNEDNIKDMLQGNQKAIDFWVDWLKPEKKKMPSFVFIIDEINRAELSRVFGELFYAIEPDYRGIEGKTKTQYSFMNTEKTFFVDKDDDYFFVPSNVYIIGTMNDIDRSVEVFDFAIRRRFAWYEIKADEVMDSILDNMNLKSDTIKEAKERLKRINQCILEIPGLNESYHIGPAYFRKLREEDNKWKKLWDYHLEPLLKEYLRGRPDYNECLEKITKGFEGNNAP